MFSKLWKIVVAVMFLLIAMETNSFAQRRIGGGRIGGGRIGGGRIGGIGFLGDRDGRNRIPRIPPRIPRRHFHHHHIPRIFIPPLVNRFPVYRQPVFNQFIADPCYDEFGVGAGFGGNVFSSSYYSNSFGRNFGFGGGYGIGSAFSNRFLAPGICH